MAYKSNNLLFRSLTDAEEAEFRAAAREKYKPHTPIAEIWHPVFRDECAKMNLEAQANVQGPLARLRHHVTGAIERGEGQPVVAQDHQGRDHAALAKEAILVQDASNLRGVLLSWHKALCEDSVVRGGQVEEFLNILYLSKVTSLLHAECDGIGSVDVYPAGKGDTKTDFRMAYDWAIRTTGEG